MSGLMSDILACWVDQQAEQARLVNAVAKAAAEHEREKCCRQVCEWCVGAGEPERIYIEGGVHFWIHAGRPPLRCRADMIRERGYQEDQATMNT
jgi:hypothetical protein